MTKSNSPEDNSLQWKRFLRDLNEWCVPGCPDFPVPIIWMRSGPESFGEVISWEKKSKMLNTPSGRRQVRDGLARTDALGKMIQSGYRRLQPDRESFAEFVSDSEQLFESVFPCEVIFTAGLSAARAAVQVCELRGDRAIDIWGPGPVFLAESVFYEWGEKNGRYVKYSELPPVDERQAAAWAAYVDRWTA